MKNNLFFLLFLLPHLLLAQLEQSNWYFGNRAALNFTTGTAVPKFDNPNQILGPSASYSDPVSGELLFYSDGKDVWNKFHLTMANGGGISTGQIKDVIIFPMPGSKDKYYMAFIENTSLKYIIIDMLSNAGGGIVIQNPITIHSDIMGQIAVIKHKYSDAYWLVSHGENSNSFFTNYINSDGVAGFTLIDNVGLVPLVYGDMVASNNGNKLVVTHYVGNDNAAEVFDFDNVCGSVSNSVVLGKETHWDNAYGAAFSPDDTKLYITYSYQLSQLIQYSGPDFQNFFSIGLSYNNFNILRLAPDNNIYMTTHDDGIPGPRIDAILKPNDLGVTCDYRLTYLSVDDGNNRSAYFELPAYAAGKQTISPIKDKLFTVSNVCLGQLTRFKFDTNNPFDSLRWQFGNDSINISYQVNPDYLFTDAGKHLVKLTVYRCGTGYVLTDTVEVSPIPQIKFPTDTILCAGEHLTLTAPSSDRYVWSTGQTTQSIMINKPQLVWLKAFNGGCFAIDSIQVKYYDNIWIALGDEYFICDDEKELVKLDAGSDFSQYKWTPTGDTTQWIIVGNWGSYFVVVKDFRGCNGSDGTQVKRRCPVNMFYPNAFTPNGDGVNDVFLPIGKDVTEYKLTIYNTWGQQIFESTNVNQAWDGTYQGKYVPDGVYIYKSEYAGYRNKKFVRFDTKGNITLMR